MTTPHAFTSDLAARYGVARKELLVLSPGNDPFNAGTENDVRLARWFAGVYEQLGKPRVHLRDFHYAVVVRMLQAPSGSTYEGTEDDWDEFQKASRKARDLGVVSPWAFVDQRTQAVYPYDEEREQPSDPTVEAGDALLVRPRLVVPYWDIDEPTLEGVPTALSLQPLAVELWIEKDSEALNQEVLPVAREFGCRVVVGAGYQSKTAAADLVRRTIDDGRPRVVLWLADADSDGESMAIATARHTEFLCRHWLAAHEPETVVPRIVMDRVALTLEQLAMVEEDIGRTIPVSPDRDREEGRVELQALAAFAPGWVAAELRRRLEEVTDPLLDALLDDWKADAENTIEAAWEAETAASQEAVIRLREKRDAILARLDLDALNAALDELEPERQSLSDEVARIVDCFGPDLPELPEGEVNLDDAGCDWLLHPDRDYEDQLNAYRRHEPLHRRRPPLVLDEPQCKFCGGSLPARRKRFCTDAHRKRYERARRE